MLINTVLECSSFRKTSLNREDSRLYYSEKMLWTRRECRKRLGNREEGGEEENLKICIQIYKMLRILEIECYSKIKLASPKIYFERIKLFQNSKPQ